MECDRLDIARLRSGIPQGFPQFVDGAADAVVEINEGAVGPEALPEILSRDDLAAPLDECNQQVEGTVLEPDASAVLLSSPAPTSNANPANSIRWTGTGWAE